MADFWDRLTGGQSAVMVHLDDGGRRNYQLPVDQVIAPGITSAFGSEAWRSTGRVIELSHAPASVAALSESAPVTEAKLAHGCATLSHTRTSKDHREAGAEGLLVSIDAARAVRNSPCQAIGIIRPTRRNKETQS